MPGACCTRFKSQGLQEVLYFPESLVDVIVPVALLQWYTEQLTGINLRLDVEEKDGFVRIIIL